MKVFHLCASSSMTGPAEPAADLCRWLLANGHEALYFGDARTEGDLFLRLDEMGVPSSRALQLSQKSGPWETLADARRLRARLDGVDVIHTHHSQDHHVALFAASGRRARLRVVRTVHARRGLEFQLLRGPVYRATDGLVTVCQAYQKELLDSFRLDPDRMAVIEGGVDSERFTPGREPALRAQWGVPQSAPLVGIVSRIKIERRHQTLVRAFQRALHAVPEAHLAIIGRGEHEPAVRSLVRELGLETSVHFTGYADRRALPAAYRALDVFAWLVEGNDGTCRAVLEAMASGLPVVAGRGGALPETVLEGETGLCAAPESEEELGRALVALLSDPEARRRMGAAGRRRAAERYTHERRGRETLAFYEKVRLLPPS